MQLIARLLTQNSLLCISAIYISINNQLYLLRPTRNNMKHKQHIKNTNKKCIRDINNQNMYFVLKYFLKKLQSINTHFANCWVNKNTCGEEQWDNKPYILLASLYYFLVLLYFGQITSIELSNIGFRKVALKALLHSLDMPKKSIHSDFLILYSALHAGTYSYSTKNLYTIVCLR